MIDQITVRLKPGQDLKQEIEDVVKQKDIKAGIIASIVGSLTKAVLRIADGVNVKQWDGLFEIVSGTGTVSVNGCHIHISIADREGAVFGGHLKQGCVINTTVELVILFFKNTEFKRLPDETTGYNELVA
ncbi:MAG: PPC domain-containing DNA-binding protein [Patescibacteria group bacterium]